ncbi:FAD-binding oxidoreductase, partial [Sneathiella sp.]|uniref:FAD-binding oxidoreductase n=1 Tax=Sneathiella sp. TaxID=1964365 RepID=UPI003562FE00
MDLIKEITNIVGDKHVLVDEADMRGFVVEWRDKFIGRARAVVQPKSTEEVAAVVKLCAATKTSLVPQGGNTSLVGGSIPFTSGDEIILSMSRMKSIRAIDR